MTSCNSEIMLVLALLQKSVMHAAVFLLAIGSLQ